MKKRDGCTGKIRHANKGRALIAARRMRICSLNAYQCHKCGGWHLGNSRSDYRRQQRFDQILRRYDGSNQP